MLQSDNRLKSYCKLLHFEMNSIFSLFIVLSMLKMIIINISHLWVYLRELDTLNSSRLLQSVGCRALEFLFACAWNSNTLHFNSIHFTPSMNVQWTWVVIILISECNIFIPIGVWSCLAIVWFLSCLLIVNASESTI